MTDLRLCVTTGWAPRTSSTLPAGAAHRICRRVTMASCDERPGRCDSHQVGHRRVHVCVAAAVKATLLLLATAAGVDPGATFAHGTTLAIPRRLVVPGGGVDARVGDRLESVADGVLVSNSRAADALNGASRRAARAGGGSDAFASALRAARTSFVRVEQAHCTRHMRPTLRAPYRYDTHARRRNGAWVRATRHRRQVGVTRRARSFACAPRGRGRRRRRRRRVAVADGLRNRVAARRRGLGRGGRRRRPPSRRLHRHVDARVAARWRRCHRGGGGGGRRRNCGLRLAGRPRAPHRWRRRAPLDCPCVRGGGGRTRGGCC